MRKVCAVVLTAVMATAVPIASAARGIPGQAAVTGGAQGTALDAQQKPLAKHTVQVRNVASGQITATGTTSASGEFTFSGLAEGTYVIELLNPAGQIVATSNPFTIEKDKVAAVPLISRAAGAMSTSGGAGFGLFGMNTAATIAVLGGAAVGTTVLVATKDGKVTICHKPTGSPAQTIDVNESAKDSHLAHGDTLGACPASPSR